MSKVKILFVGDTSYEMYVSAFYNVAKKMDDVEADLIDFNMLNTRVSKKDFFLRIERHYKRGVHVSQINRKIIRYVENNDVDIVFLYTCDIITPATVKRISKKAYVAIYNNDNPFSDFYPKYMWKNMLNSIKYANIVYSFRTSNIKQYERLGAKRVDLLRGYYIHGRNYYIPDEDINLIIPKVCYIGHYEDDGREEYIEMLVEAGIEVGVPADWPKNIQNNHLKYLDNTHSRYNEILNKSKIAIVFLSSINKDTYTTRTFEIPVVKTLMVAPRNDDVISLYDEDKEAVFYDSKEELLQKVQYYLEHEEERKCIAEAGFDRVMRDGHEAKDRVKQIISDFEKNSEF